MANTITITITYEIEAPELDELYNTDPEQFDSYEEHEDYIAAEEDAILTDAQDNWQEWINRCGTSWVEDVSL